MINVFAFVFHDMFYEIDEVPEFSKHQYVGLWYRLASCSGSLSSSAKMRHDTSWLWTLSLLWSAEYEDIKFSMTDESIPELIYFNAKGRAEAIRLLLAEAGVEYKDTRFEDGINALVGRVFCQATFGRNVSRDIKRRNVCHSIKCL